LAGRPQEAVQQADGLGKGAGRDTVLVEKTVTVLARL
jgi:hypothetical protein